MNGSRLSSWPDRSSDVVCQLVRRVICSNGSIGQKMRKNWVWSVNSPYFTLSFSFQINISVKISAGLLRNLCGNLDEIKSSSAINRVV